MKGKLKLLLGAASAAFLLLGCTSSSVPVGKSFSQLTANKNNAYVVFARPYNFIGGAYSIDIMEFDENSFEPKLVAQLSNDEKIVYPVHPGKTYFFTNVGANENIAVVNLKAGEIQYINMGITKNSIFAPVLLDKSRLALTNSLRQMTCNESMLKRFLFSKKGEKNKNGMEVYVQKNNETNTYISPMQYEITCKNQKVLNVEDLYHDVSIQEISEFPTIEATEASKEKFVQNKKDFQDSIKTLWPVWDLKLRNVPRSEETVVFIEQLPDNNEIAHYGSVHFKVQASGKNVNKKLLAQTISTTNQITSQIKGNGEPLRAKIDFNILDDGSMVGRYFTSGFSASGAFKDIGILDMTITFSDNKGKIVGKMRITTMEGGGLLGGINTMINDATKVMKQYIVNNYIRQ